MTRFYILLIIFIGFQFANQANAYEYCENIFLTQEELDLKISRELFEQNILANIQLQPQELFEYPILFNDGIPVLNQVVLDPVSRTDLMYMEPIVFNRLMDKIFKYNQLPMNLQFSEALPYYQFEGMDRKYVTDILDLVSRKGFSNPRELLIKKVTDLNKNDVIAYIVQRKLSEKTIVNLYFVLITIEDGHKFPKIKYSFDEFTFL